MEGRGHVTFSQPPFAWKTVFVAFSWLARFIFQKRPDIHKIRLSIKLRFPPPPENSVNLEDFLLICTLFPHFGPFSRGGGFTKFCGQDFYGNPDFSEFYACSPRKVF